MDLKSGDLGDANCINDVTRLLERMVAATAGNLGRKAAAISI
ncbi:MAG TPA: hypothetical protein VJ798_05195 [Rhizomicrobium sp.]|nr:hypothetical protein [Rhizomicrobium sp.]